MSYTYHEVLTGYITVVFLTHPYASHTTHTHAVTPYSQTHPYMVLVMLAQAIEVDHILMSYR